MVSLERIKKSQRLSSIANISIGKHARFMKENELDSEMAKIFSDFEAEVEQKMGVKPIMVDYKLTQDYPHELWEKGVGHKEYQYKYIIPQKNVATKEPNPYGCYFNIKKRFPLDEREMAHPEIWGSADCVVDDNELLREFENLHENVIVAENGKWTIKPKS